MPLGRRSRSEGPELLADESEEDQVAIPAVHNTILAGPSLPSKAEATEDPHGSRVIGKDARVEPVKPELPESGGDQQGRRFRGVPVSPVGKGNPVSDVGVPEIEPDLIEPASTDDLSAPSKYDEKVALRSFLETPLAPTDEFPSVSNRVTGRQMNRPCHSAVPKRIRDGGSIGKLRDTEQQATPDDGEP